MIAKKRGEDPVWVWTIKYRRVAAFSAWLPAFLRVDCRQRAKRVLLYDVS